MQETNRIKYGYIFDFDGVLVNTMNAHFECYRQALAEFNVPIEREKFYYQAGMTGIEQIEYFVKASNASVDAGEVYARKREIWEAHEFPVESIPCNLQLLKCLKNCGYPVAIASGSSRPSILPIMEEFDIVVDALVTCEDVKRGKPHPDLFLCAARNLDVEPEHCTVIEDSDVGIQAAQAAGMKVMRFYDSTHS